MSRRSGGPVAALALVGMFCAACSSGSGQPAATSTTAAGPSSTTTSAATVPTSTSSTVAGTTRCTTANLKGAVVGSSGAAGTIETTVALTSTASSPCILGGFPGAELLGATGSPLPTTVVRGGSYSFTRLTPTTVTVAPGGSAYFNIGYSDVPVGAETSCPTSAALEVTPPNAFNHVVVAAMLSPCGGGTMAVSPVFGDTGPDTQTTAPAAG